MMSRMYSDDNKGGGRDYDMRVYRRKEASLPAIIKIVNEHNYLYCFLARIMNISEGGMRISLDEKDSKLCNAFKTSDKFVVVFENKDKSRIFDAICRPVYVSEDQSVKIGSCFVEVDDDLISAVRSDFSMIAGSSQTN